MPRNVAEVLSRLRQDTKQRLNDYADMSREAPQFRSFVQQRQAQNRLRGAGRRNLERFERAVDFLQTVGGVRLGHLQARLLQAGRIIMLRRMFGAEIVNEVEYLRRRFGITKLDSSVAVLFPRRSGKTTAQTVIAACVLVSQPDGNVCCFNLKSRQSKAWFSQTWKWVEKFQQSDEFRFRVLQRNGQEKVVIRNCTGTDCELSSYPGPADAEGSNFRGMGARIALMNIDEFFFIRPSVYPTILPLLVNGAALMLTSSQNKDPDNPIRRMINAKYEDSGEDAVLRFNWLQACSDCRIAKQEERCTHIAQQPQHFQKRADLRRVRALTEPFGDGGFEREMGNVTGRSWIDSVFEEDWVASLADERNHVDLNSLNREFSHVFLTLDPAGEGFSKNALTTVAIDNQNKPLGSPFTALIVGAETFPARATEDVSDFFVDHINALRQTHWFRHAMVVVNIESNLPMIAESVRRQLEQRGVINTCIISQDPKRLGDGTTVMRTGTRMTRGRPAEIAHALAQLLAARALRFATPFVCVHPSRIDISPKQKIIKELRAFKRVIHPPTLNGRKRHYEATYEGRDNSNNPTTTDTVDSLGHTCCTLEVFRTSPSYQPYRINGRDY